MKSFYSLLLATLCFSATASAAATAIAPASKLENDRTEIAPGVVGISHTENFEYVCETDAGGGEKNKTYLDTDFVGGTGYRLAVGFVGGGSVAGTVAAEATVVDAKRARCPGLCLSLTIKSLDDGSQSSVNFQEDPVTKIITISTVEAGKTAVLGTCVKNEVE